ncbi:hypothetical protein HJG60_008013 [Phyllostomus discolor]|uniref:Uncharacterized protein n=1 Tax=Phyllostomus discolor TaxID=89673 RepID=A0A834BI16_9CHIR|nr:hypothetical protein HJG60_008013 [Phyllostomus discolor]
MGGLPLLLGESPRPSGAQRWRWTRGSPVSPKAAVGVRVHVAPQRGEVPGGLGSLFPPRRLPATALVQPLPSSPVRPELADIPTPGTASRSSECRGPGFPRHPLPPDLAAGRWELAATASRLPAPVSARPGDPAPRVGTGD